MTMQAVTDIDVLALAVRDRESRRLIEEAVTAYRGGALRSAIMSVWIAIVHDVFSKARELAGQGDAASISFVGKLDTAIEHKNIVQMQTLERELLDTAKDNLQLVTPHEYETLRRIQEDRHLCAHPAFITEDELFQPSPDLVRSHLVHALQCLLIHAPLQGKSALNRFKADVLSPSFPSTEEGIRKFVSAKYLDRSKDALVANLIKVLLKGPFLEGEEELLKKKRQLAWTLSEVAAKKTRVFEDVARPFVGQFFDGVDDGRLLSICTFIGAESQLWGWLSEPVKLRIVRLIEECEIEDLKEHLVFDAFSIPEMADTLLAKFTSFQQDERIQLLSDNPSREFVPFGIDIYSRAGSPREADRLGQTVVLPLARHFGADDIALLVDAVLGNSQISYASGTADVLVEVFKLTVSALPASRGYWQRFVDEMTAQHGGKTDMPYSYPSIRAKLEAA
ncbi:hypothetical protein [Agrobacterium tumefaciens]|uniref:hypothetical protein n=1 Tax=Agrobacterium tumefaciens TaxID=358 RepID=UPI00285A21BF|nr:hypothetical protein [Agrobacterium tumefaciens]MDR6587431.1 hypothetical protein [Agrobacterium tumefaciens]